MLSQNDVEYFTRRLESERRMASEAMDGAARRLHIRLASEYARRTRKAGSYKVIS
ncbi:hypothetical protein [Rhizorhapis sp.]|uniref:hypothetical protein n=1 Tax=Rhizorhapis sp. TaxID=1968842 RepID=UPI002B48DF99|nr:hypothetical protein [Rhizorhapis sp.]